MCEQSVNASGEIFCLNSEFSTTMMVTEQPPVIENHPEDQFETKLFLPEGEGRQEEGGLRTRGYFKRSLPDKPLISVITVVYNGEKHLEETIQSVLKQTYDNVEYIIIDGRSTDGTLNIIHKYEGWIDYWISESDRGIYDAMNKGLRCSTGDLIGILNSDDYYATNGLEIIANYATQHPEKDCIFGTVKKQKIISRYKPWKIYYNFNFYTAHSSGFFIRKRSQKIVGLYNLKYKCSADYDLFYRMFVHHKMQGIKTKRNELVGFFRHYGYSYYVSFIQNLCEQTQIRLDNKQNHILVLLIFVLRYLKHIKKL